MEERPDRQLVLLVIEQTGKEPIDRGVLEDMVLGPCNDVLRDVGWHVANYWDREDMCPEHTNIKDTDCPVNGLDAMAEHLFWALQTWVNCRFDWIPEDD